MLGIGDWRARFASEWTTAYKRMETRHLLLEAFRFIAETANKGAPENHRSVATTEWPCGSWTFLIGHQALTAAVAELLR